MARKTKQDALLTRELILDAAQSLFQQQGVSRTSLQHIAQAAQVTRGAIYWHFSDKLAVFKALLERASLPYEEILLDVELQDSASPLEKILLTISRMVGLISDDERIRIVFDIISHKIELVGEFATMHENYTSHMDRTISIFARHLQQANENGELNLTEQQARNASIGVNALVEGLVHTWLHAPHNFDLHSVALINARIYLQGLKNLPANFPSSPV